MLKTTLPTKILTSYKAKVVIEATLAKQLRYFVDQVPTECQWYTQVRREEIDGVIVFTCFGDILIPPQKVGPEDVESDPIGIAKMWSQEGKLLEASRPDLTDLERDALLNERTAAAWNWCHSHVRMPIAPSNTDNEQWQTWVKLHHDNGAAEHPPMMLIVNKKDEIFVRVYDPTTKVQFENIAVEIGGNTDPELAYVTEALATKLTKIEPPKPKEEPKPTPSPWGSGRDSWSTGYGSHGGGSQNLRQQIADKTKDLLGAGGKASAPLSGGRPTPPMGGASSASYQVLNGKDIANLTDAFDKATDARHATREQGFKSLFKWIDSNSAPGTWKAIQELLSLHAKSEQDPAQYLDVLKGYLPNTYKDVNEGQVMKDLVDFEQDTASGLDLLDAVVAFDAVGEEAAAAAIMDALCLYQDALWTPVPAKEYRVPDNLQFRMLD